MGHAGLSRWRGVVRRLCAPNLRKRTMKAFDRINRRTHLYLGLFLMPWLLMYGVSSFIVIHQTWFRRDKEPVWEPLFQQAYARPVSDQGDLRATAQEILKECNL